MPILSDAQLAAIQHDADDLLRADPAVAVARAADGYLPAVHALAAHAPAALPPQLGRPALEALCAHLAPAQRPAYRYAVRSCCAARHPSPALALAVGALAALAALRPFLAADRPLRVALARHWPAVLDCALRVLEVCVLAPPPHDTLWPAALAAPSAVLAAAYAVSGAPPLRDARAGTLAAQLWLRADSRDAGAGADTALRAVFRAAAGDARRTRLLADTLLRAAKFDAAHVAQLALARLRACVTTAPVDYAALRALLQTLGVLSACAPHPLRQGLLDGGEVPAVTRIFAAFAGRGINGADAKKVLVLEEFINFYYSRLKIIPTSLYASQALQYGFLQAFVDSAPVLPALRKGALERARQLLATHMVHCLLSRSLIHTLADAFMSIPEGRLQKKLEHSCFAKEWKAFADLFLERFIVLRIFESSCNNVHGGSLATPAMKNASPSTPRQTPTAPPRRKTASAPPRLKPQTCSYDPHTRTDNDDDESDAPFLRFLAETDAARHLPGLLVLAARAFPGAPLRTLGISADYSTLPRPTLAPFPAAEAATDHAHPDAPPASAASIRRFQRAQRAAARPLAALSAAAPSSAGSAKFAPSSSAPQPPPHAHTLLRTIRPHGRSVAWAYAPCAPGGGWPAHGKRLPCPDHADVAECRRPAPRAVRRAGAVDGAGRALRAGWDLVDLVLDRLGVRAGEAGAAACLRVRVLEGRIDEIVGRGADNYPDCRCPS
ncbi:hypothetical protein DFH11DRAFT_1877580 [Phellopilus nigrolimitatus]|nr:hypothetical protein DFH11DRAFT_1877580 [Phellopilus nigrolimitatus]